MPTMPTSFVDAMDTLISKAKSRSSKPGSISSTTSHQESESRKGSITSVESPIEKSPSSSSLSKKVSSALQPSYPAGWESSSRNPRRKKAPKRVDSDDSLTSSPNEKRKLSSEYNCPKTPARHVRPPFSTYTTSDSLMKLHTLGEE